VRRTAFQTQIFSWLGYLLLAAIPCCLAQSKPALETVLVKIESTQWDGSKLLAKLNEHGKGHRLIFEQADASYAYRIVFAVAPSTGAQGGSSILNNATVEVYRPDGNEVFKFTRNNRLGEGNLTNAVANEIVKRLAKIQSESAG
jgi:hypothetical protein